MSYVQETRGFLSRKAGHSPLCGHLEDRAQTHAGAAMDRGSAAANGDAIKCAPPADYVEAVMELQRQRLTISEAAATEHKVNVWSCCLVLMFVAIIRDPSRYAGVGFAWGPH